MIQSLYTTAAEAVAIVESGNRVFVHGSAATPLSLLAALFDRVLEEGIDAKPPII